MHLRAILPLLALTLFLCSPPAEAQRRKGKSKPPEEVTYHDGELAAAREQAAGRNVPVLVLCILEGEEASERFQGQLLENRPLAAATANAIVVLVNDGRHEQIEIKVKDVDGETVKKSVCEAYRTETCEVHRRNWDTVYQQLIADDGTEGRWDLPQAMILLPNFELLTRIYSAQPPSDSEMIKALKVARTKAGPGITLEQLREVRRLAEMGRNMGSAKLWSASWNAWNQVLAITTSGVLAEEAEVASETALKELGLVLEQTVERMVPSETGEAGRAYRKLVELADDLGDSDMGDEFRKAIKKAERSSRIKEELARTKLEIEGEAILDQVHALIQDGEEKKAQRLLKKLLGKRFLGTQVAERGRELLDD